MDSDCNENSKPLKGLHHEKTNPQQLNSLGTLQKHAKTIKTW
jgi:hypothetical protein